MAQVKLARHILTNELVRFTVLMSMMDCFRTIVVDAPRQPAPHSLAHSHFTAHSHPYATRQVAIKIINKARLSDVVSVISMLRLFSGISRARIDASQCRKSSV